MKQINIENLNAGRKIGIHILINFFKRFYLFIFRERGREGEREGEKHQCVVASHVAPTEGPGPQPRHVP